MSGIRRNWLGRAFMAGLVTATTMATPIAASAEPGGIAEPDEFTVAEDSILSPENYFDVLANDPGSVDGPAVITEFSQGLKGTVGEVKVAGKIVKLTYTPNADAFGPDEFTYTVTSGTTVEIEQVNVQITGSQDDPVANDDELPLTGEIVENGVAIDITADILDNDVDVDLDSFYISSVDPTETAGTVTLTPSDGEYLGVVTYEPTSDSATTDSFKYQITDEATNVSAWATVNITITAVDDAPLANDDGVNPDDVEDPARLNLDEEGSLLIDVLGNDVDLDEEAIVIDSITAPTNGTAVLDADTSKILYTHDGSETISDSFTYGVVGGNSATVYVSINPIDDLPGAENDGSIDEPFEIVNEGGSIVLDVLANDLNADRGPLEVNSISNVPDDHTAVVITEIGEDLGKILFTHVGSDLADISFTYELNGGSTARVYLAVRNQIDNGAFNVESPVLATIEEDADPTTVPVLTVGQKDDDNEVLVLSAIGDAGVNPEAGLNPTKGTATIETDVDTEVKTLVYTPDPDANGEDTFTVEVSDGTTGDEVTVTVTMTINPVNDAPVAQADTYNNRSQYDADNSEVTPVLVLEDTATGLPVLSNDSDVDNDDDELSVVLVGELDARIGTLTPEGAGVLFTPADDYFGSFRFDYKASDSVSESAAVTVNVTVVAQPDPITADDDDAFVPEDGVVYVNVLTNDTDVDGFGLELLSVEQPDGAFTAIAGNRIRVQPDPNFNGELVFTYTVGPRSDIAYDYYGASEYPCGDTGFFFFFGPGAAICEPATATVTVQVTPVNDRPDAEPDTGIETDEDTPVTIDVLDNDSDIDGDRLSIWSVGPAALGTTKIVAGEILYTPNENEFGSDSFVYYAYDGKALSVASVNLTIAPIADAPTIADVSVSGPEDQAVVVELTVADPDPDNESFEIDVTSVSVPGATTQLDGTTLTFTPPANWTGIAEVAVLVTSDGGLQAEGVVSIEITSVNDVPTIEDVSVDVDEDDSVSIPITFDDVEDSDETISIFQGAAHGTAVVDGSNVIYTPTADYFGPDTVRVSITDKAGASAVATVSITVNSVNDLPYLYNALAVVPEDGSFTLYVNFGDVEDDLAELLMPLSVFEQPTSGTVVLHPEDPTKVIYTPFANVYGTDTFKLITTDSDGASAIGTVRFTITSINDVPTIDDTSAVTDEDESVIIPIAFDDIEDDLTITILEGPTNGTTEVDGSNVIYTPAANFNGPDSFTVKTTDNDGASAEATVDVTVNAVNDAPTVADTNAAVDEDGSVIIPITAADVDSDISMMVSSGPSRGSATVDGFNVTYTPNLNANGADSFQVRVVDGDGASAVAIVSVTIAAVNDNPTAAPCAGVTVESGKSIVINLSACGNDVDGDILTVGTGSMASANGSATKTADQAVTYTPNAGFVGADSVGVTLTDGKGGSVAVSVGVTVTAPANPFIGAVGVNGQVVRIYSAMLGRLPDAAGFNYWTTLRAEGLSLERMIRLFAESPEFKATFGNRIVEDTNAQWVDFVYGEIMHRTPDAGGRAYWLELLGYGGVTRSAMVVLFAESVEYKVVTQTS